LILLGGLFLSANVLRFDIAWLKWLQFVFPSLLVLWGAIKLIRHFTWTKDRLLARPGRAGLFSGLFWATIGTMWLLDLSGAVNAFEFFGIYWPFLLIIFGFGKIIDYYRLQGQLQIRPAEVIGILFLALLGMASSRISEAHWPLVELPILWGEDDIRIGEIMGERFTFTTTESVPADNLAEIEVSNLYGNVTIRPEGDNNASIQLKKEILESTEVAARAVADQVQLSISIDGSTLRLGTNRGDLRLEKGRFKSHLDIALPPHFSAKVSNRYGEVRVSGIDGICNVKNTYGDVVVERIGGNVFIANSYDRVVVRDVARDLTVENHRGSIQAENVEGAAELRSDYDTISARRIGGDLEVANRFGRIQIERVGGKVSVEGPGSQVFISSVENAVVARNSHKALNIRSVDSSVDVDTSYSQVELNEIGGPVQIRASHAQIDGKKITSEINVKAIGSRISLSELKGSFDIATSLRDVVIENFNASGEVQNEYGEITLATSGPIRGRLTAATKEGQITLRVPRDSSFTLSARAMGGKVVSDFPLQLEAGASVLDTVVGNGGPEVRLQTAHADIHVMKR
jgi:hypothetical protein